MPSKTSDFVLLDAGANSDGCEPQHLAQFAVMGNVYAREILGIEKPRVGILSNGSEETKGTELTREALRICPQLDLNFIGYVEGFDLFDDALDVAVTDGFTGNVVLKTAESLSRAISHLLKCQLSANPVRQLGALLSKGAFQGLKQRLDPEVYGGAVLLGLNGIVVKAHGSSKAPAIASAIGMAAEEIAHGVNQIISQQITRANERLAAAETPVSPSVPA